MASKKTAPEGPIEVPEIISILPLRNSVLFPGSIIPIDVGRKKSVRLVEEAISKERPVIGSATRRDNSDHRALLGDRLDRKSTRLNSSHANSSYGRFCVKKKCCRRP